MSKPVFCSDCKYHREDDASIECRSLNNIRIVNGWYRQHSEYINSARQINKDSNCVWYKPNLFRRLFPRKVKEAITDDLKILAKEAENNIKNKE